MELSWKRAGQILIGIFILAAFLRLSNLGENSFVADEFLDMNSSYGYAQTGEWQAWDWNRGAPAEMNVHEARDERAWIYKAQVAALFQILPPTEAVARSISVFWGLVSVLVVFWSAWTFTRKKEIGLIAALLFALSTSAIIFNRHLRMYAMFFPVFLALATTLYVFMERPYAGTQVWFKKFYQRFGLNLPYGLAALVLLVISFLTHQLTINIIAIAGVYLAVMALRRYKHEKELKNKYAVFLGLGAAALALAFLFAREALGGFQGALVFFENHYSYFGHIVRDFGHPLLGAVLILFGAWSLLRREDSFKEGLYLLIAWLVPLSMAVWLWNRVTGEQYIYFVQAFGMILAAAGLSAILSFVRAHTDIFGKKALVGGLVLMLLLVPNWGYFLQENNTYHETSSSTNPNYRKVFGYVMKQRSETDVLIARNYRNYYWAGADMPVYDFGGELTKDRITLERLQEIMAEHPSGWFVASGNDMTFVTNEAEDYIIRNLERVSNSQVRGDILVYRWGAENR